MMEKKRAGGKAYNAKNAIQGLRKHALNFSAHKT